MSDRTLVLGDPVVSLGESTVIDDGAVIVEGDSITAVGPRADLEQRGPFQQVLGGPHSLVMPGLINCHYHSELAIGPGLYQYIFERANVHVHSSYGPISEEDLYQIVQIGLVNAIRGGQTAAVDMYYGRPSLPQFGAAVALQAYLDTGFRVAFGLVSRDQNVYVHEPNEQFLARLPTSLAQQVTASPMGYAWPVADVMATYDQLVRDWDHREGLIRTILAPDWTPACSDELYRLCRRKADEYDTGITSHVLETRSEMRWNTHINGRPALTRLADLGVLGPDMTCAHFVWVTDEELKIFADSGAVASNNPGSNLRLSSGICRTRDILATGGRIAFGTDGISFADNDDMFAELRLACYLQRDPRAFDEVRLDSEQVLRAAGQNGARAIRHEGRIGALSPGMLADLLVLDKTRMLFPEGRFQNTPILDVLLDRAQGTDLRHVMINGKVVMEDGRITVLDEQRLRDNITESVARRVFAPDEQVRHWTELGRLVEPTVVDFYRPGYADVLPPTQVFNTHRA